MAKYVSGGVRYVRKANLRPHRLKLQFKKRILRDKLYLDIVGTLPMTEEGYKCILTCQDNLSKNLLANSMITQTADEVTLIFWRYVILHYVILNLIVTDQG